MIIQSVAQGMGLGNLQILDSTHPQADVEADKDRERRVAGKPPCDPESRSSQQGAVQYCGTRHRRRKKRIHCKGYKTHVSVNAEAEVVTSLEVMPSSAPDDEQFPDLQAHDQVLRLSIRAYGGDRSCENTDIYGRLVELLKGLDFRLFCRGYNVSLRQVNGLGGGSSIFEIVVLSIFLV